MTRNLGPHLWQRRNTKYIWFRLAVPKAVQHRFGTTPITFSLNTTDPKEASVLAGMKRAEYYALWGLLPQSANVSPPKQEDPISVAVAVAYDDMLAAMEDKRRDWPKDDAGYSAKLAEREADLRRMTRRLRDGDTSQWAPVADRIIASRGLDLPKGTPAYSDFVVAIAKASLDAIGVFIRTHHGEIDATPRSMVVTQTKAKAEAKANKGETLMELFESWSAEMLAKGARDGRKGKRPDTVNQDRKVMARFAEFVGEQRAVDSITAQEVAEFRDTLRMLPPKWMSKRELRGRSMREAAQIARAAGMVQMAFTNINKQLSVISPLYKWLRKQPRWAGLVNPVDGLFYDDVKGTNPRPPFSTSALNRIITSPIFTGFEADGKEHISGDKHADDWRRWTPLVAMFTGARIGEIAQLQLGDVRQHRGVWFIQIRHEAKEGLTTKSGESRFAAVHPLLERIGFIAFHRRLLRAANGNLDAALFPELKPNSRGFISGTPSEWWRDYLADIGVKDATAPGGDGFGTHSFRHTLADRFREEAELLDSKIAVVLGHSVKTQTGKYGELPQGTVTMHKAWMDAVRFDGVSFDHLIAIDDGQCDRPIDEVVA